MPSSDARRGILAGMILLPAALSAATHASTHSSTSGCTRLDLVTVPAAGATVPPDVLFTVIAEGLFADCSGPGLYLVDDAGAGVPWTAEEPAWGVYRRRPTEPLELGRTYVLHLLEPYYGHDLEVPVTVGEPEPVPSDPPAVTFDVERRCSSATARVAIEAEAAEPVSGVVVVDYDVGGERWSTFQIVEAETRLSDRELFADEPGICATVRLEDLSGAAVWSVGPLCTDEPPCPLYGPPEEVSYTMEPVCDEDEPKTRIAADIDLPRAEDRAWGRLSMEVTTSLGPQGSLWSTVLSGPDADTHAELTVLGGHDVCFELVLRRATVEETWRDGPYCAEEPVTCPEEPDPTPAAPAEASGCGCGGRRPAPLALALLLGAAARRRSVRKV